MYYRLPTLQTSLFFGRTSFLRALGSRKRLYRVMSALYCAYADSQLASLMSIFFRSWISSTLLSTVFSVITGRR